jgi:hypothetical protein
MGFHSVVLPSQIFLLPAGQPPPPMNFFRRRWKNLEGFFEREVEKICHQKVTKLFTKNFTCPPVNLVLSFKGGAGVEMFPRPPSNNFGPPQAEFFSKILVSAVI